MPAQLAPAASQRSQVYVGVALGRRPRAGRAVSVGVRRRRAGDRGRLVTVAASAAVAASTAIKTAIVMTARQRRVPILLSRLRHVVHLLVSLPNLTRPACPELSESRTDRRRETGAVVRSLPSARP